jgi:hypothetical protein
MGAAGRNAAAALLRDLSRPRWRGLLKPSHAAP